jgi:hypothetical protein
MMARMTTAAAIIAARMTATTAAIPEMIKAMTRQIRGAVIKRIKTTIDLIFRRMKDRV